MQIYIFLLEIKLINSCRNTFYPLQNIKKCCSSSTWSCLQTKHVLSSTGMGTPQISYFPVCIRVEPEKTQFWSLSQSHARGRQTRSYPLLLVCPRDTPNIWCKFSHTSPDLLKRSGQVKKSGRIKVGRWNERVRAKRCDVVDWDSA